MGFTRIDGKLVKGEKFYYEDRGYVSPGAKTRKFAVTSRRNMSLAGFVKYFAQSRQYIFFPLNCLLDKDCLREIADYCVEVTTAHRNQREAFPTSA